MSASSPSGTLIGEPVAATDADTGDTLTYSLEGRDAPSFDINETNGQLRTKSGITLIVGTTYTVTVAADDTKDIARISVSIEATAAPPNNAPVFSEGASATRSVGEERAGRDGHRAAREGDGRRFGRHADVQPGGDGRRLV